MRFHVSIDLITKYEETTAMLTKPTKSTTAHSVLKIIPIITFSPLTFICNYFFFPRIFICSVSSFSSLSSFSKGLVKIQTGSTTTIIIIANITDNKTYSVIPILFLTSRILVFHNPSIFVLYIQFKKYIRL